VVEPTLWTIIPLLPEQQQPPAEQPLQNMAPRPSFVTVQKPKGRLGLTARNLNIKRKSSNRIERPKRGAGMPDPDELVPIPRLQIPREKPVVQPPLCLPGTRPRPGANRQWVKYESTEMLAASNLPPLKPSATLGRTLRPGEKFKPDTSALPPLS
jgi:hypothetical protein